LFPVAAEAFGPEATFLGSAAWFAGLKASFSSGFPAALFGLLAASFQLFAEQGAGEVAVEVAGTFALAFYLDSGGEVFEIDAGRGFVDFLATGTGATNEAFEKIALPDAEACHALKQLWVPVHGSKSSVFFPSLPGIGAKKKAAQLMVLQENPLTCIKTDQPGCLNQPCSIARTEVTIRMIGRGAPVKLIFFQFSVLA
jgi:hypothetical protein